MSQNLTMENIAKSFCILTHNIMKNLLKKICSFIRQEIFGIVLEQNEIDYFFPKII